MERTVSERFSNAPNPKCNGESVSHIPSHSERRILTGERDSQISHINVTGNPKLFNIHGKIRLNEAH